MSQDEFFEIAKIIDNEYIGKRETFTARKGKTYWHLSTNVCDWAYCIRVYVTNNKISTIEVLGEDTPDWRPIMPKTWNRIEAYLSTLNPLTNGK